MNFFVNLISIEEKQSEIYIIYILGAPETDDQQRLRFQVELEFVQCLANPNYLNCEQMILSYFSFLKDSFYL